MMEEVKKYLKITWEYENENISGYIERGKAYINDLTGTKVDFEENLNAKALLFDYCRYVYNSALEYFEHNFSKEIVRLQLKEATRIEKSN